MANNPDTGEVQSLEPPVDRPEGPTKDLGADRGDSGTDGIALSERVDEGGSVPQAGSDDKVADHVVKAKTSLADEEVGGDGGTNLAQ